MDNFPGTNRKWKAGYPATDPELDAIANILLKKLEPLIRQIIAETKPSKKGVLVGAREIAEYVGIAQASTNTTLTRWYHKYGFPMNKNTNGKWWTTTALIDRWMMAREVMMRKGRALGFFHLDARAKGGKLRDINPEYYSQEQKDKIMTSIREDRAKASMTNI